MEEHANDTSIKYMLSEEDIRHITLIASTTAVKAYKDSMKKTEKQRSRSSRTKSILAGYRRRKKLVDEYPRTFTKEEEMDLRWSFLCDLMGPPSKYVNSSETVIRDFEKKKQENVYCIDQVEKAVDMYAKEVQDAPYEAQRRFRVMYDMYISNDVSTVEDIAERENVSIKSIYRDINIACDIMGMYLML